MASKLNFKICSVFALFLCTLIGGTLYFQAHNVLAYSVVMAAGGDTAAIAFRRDTSTYKEVGRVFASFAVFFIATKSIKNSGLLATASWMLFIVSALSTVTWINESMLLHTAGTSGLFYGTAIEPAKLFYLNYISPTALVSTMQIANSIAEIGFRRLVVVGAEWPFYSATLLMIPAMVILSLSSYFTLLPQERKGRITTRYTGKCLSLGAFCVMISGATLALIDANMEAVARLLSWPVDRSSQLFLYFFIGQITVSAVGVVRTQQRQLTDKTMVHKLVTGCVVLSYALSVFSLAILLHHTALVELSLIAVGYGYAFLLIKGTAAFTSGLDSCGLGRRWLSLLNGGAYASGILMRLIIGRLGVDQKSIILSIAIILGMLVYAWLSKGRIARLLQRITR